MSEDARNKGDSAETCSSAESQEQGSETKVVLQTLEEHRLATRFEKKRVTLQTWRKVKRDAYKLIASGDRENLVEALYLLLELIWLRPRGCCLPPLFLNAGSIYLAFNYLDEAATSYRNCLRLDPNSWKARYNLGIALARAEDFVDAKHQFDFALQICPSDAAHDKVSAMVKEIEEIVQERNGRAFRATNKAREFTSQYLTTLRSVAAKPSEISRTIVSEDYTSTCHNSPPSLSPLLFHKVDGWQGVIAGLLHRLHASAFTQSILVEREFYRIDLTGSGCISIEKLEQVLLEVTGSRASASEHNELTLICQDGYASFFSIVLLAAIATHGLPTHVACGPFYRELLYQLLVPNVETFAALDEMRRVGVFHAALSWALTRKRVKRSEKSRQGGFWYWLELPMAKWISQIELPLTLVKQLRSSGWVTPLDTLLKSDCLDPASASLSLSFADRGVFVFEVHRARTVIQNEASTVLQMYFRRLVRNRGRATSFKRITKMVSTSVSTYKRQSSAISDLQNVVTEDTSTEQQIVTNVLECLAKLVDDVVTVIRLERRDYEEKIRWQEIPVRTEKRQATSQAVGMLQNLMSHSDKAG